MLERLFFAVRCKCGRLLEVRDDALEEFASLEEAKRTLMRQGWQRIAVCLFPPGCGQSVSCTPDKLEIFQKD